MPRAASPQNPSGSSMLRRWARAYVPSVIPTSSLPPHRQAIQPTTLCDEPAPSRGERCVMDAKRRYAVMHPSRSGGRGRQLTAGAVDVRATGVAHGRRHSARPQPAHELALDTRLRGCPLRARSGVQRNRVDVHPTPPSSVELVAEKVSTPPLVIHVADQGVLDADPTTRHREVAVCRVDGLV